MINQRAKKSMLFKLATPYGITALNRGGVFCHGSAQIFTDFFIPIRANR
jgi:hypothetical protein